MAALPSPSPLTDDVSSPARSVDPAGLTPGLAYVNRCLRGHRPFGILTGSTSTLDVLIERVAAECTANDHLHNIRIATPTDSVQVFLAACLGQLGFDLYQAGLDDLHNLLVVFLRHESARGRRTIAIIQSTDQFGPRVLEFMQTLSRVRAGATPAITFFLTGSPQLHRVLDSPGMSALRQFTRERFDLDKSLAWIAGDNRRKTVVVPWSRSGEPRPAPATSEQQVAQPSLVVMLDGAIIERRPLSPGRLIIGRSPNSGLHLESRYVSRHHAVLIVTPESTTVVDLRSTNATLVNGQPTTNQQLEHGDLLAIGNYRLRFHCRGRTSSPVAGSCV